MSQATCASCRFAVEIPPPPPLPDRREVRAFGFLVWGNSVHPTRREVHQALAERAIEEVRCRWSPESRFKRKADWCGRHEPEVDL